MMRAFLSPRPLLLMAAALVALAALFAPGAQPAQAQSAGTDPGSLDLTFNPGGKVTTAIGSGNDLGNALAVQPDGKIVVAGYSSNGTNDDFAVARYTAAGALDTTFSTDGKVTTAIGSDLDRAYAVAVGSEGKIVVAGASDNGSDNDFAVVRYTAAGVLDTTFSADGKVTTAIGSSHDQGYAVAVGSDGKIVVAGLSNNGSNNDFAVVRYTAAGALDTTFSSDGKVTTAVGSGEDIAYALAVGSDGKIVVAGYSHNDFAVARYTAAGALDTTFSADGKVVTAIGSSHDEGRAVAVQSDGKIVVAGFSIQGTYTDIAVARYNADGTLDTGFSADGKATTAIGSSSDQGYAVAVQSDGKIVVSGWSSNGSDNDFAVVRYTAAGALDTTFSADGKVTTAIGSGHDYGFGVAIQFDGKIVVAGASSNGSDNDFAVVRYNGQGSSAPGAPTGLAAAPGNGQLVVAWTAPSGTVTGYDVEYKVSTATSWTDASHAGTGTSQTITSLTNGTLYDVRVRAATANGNGPWATATGTPLSPAQAKLTLSTRGTLREGGGPVTVTYTLDQLATCDMSTSNYFGGSASTYIVQNDYWLESVDRLEQYIEAFNEENDPAESKEPDIAGVDVFISRQPDIAKGETTATQTIVVIDDVVVDHGESFVLGATMLGLRDCDATTSEEEINFAIRDNERKNGRSDPSTGRAGSASPTRLTLTADKTTVREGEDSEIRVNATLDKPALSTMSVMVAFSGTATRNPNNTSEGGFAREGDYDVYSGSAQKYRILIVGGETTAIARMVIALYDDGEVERTENIILTATVDKPKLSRTLRLSIRDNDRAGVTVSQTALTAAPGDYVYYTVKLNSRPTADVTITPTSSSTGRVTVSPATLTFTAANWKREQRVTVTRVAPGSATITHRATSDDSSYRRSAASVTVLAGSPGAAGEDGALPQPEDQQQQGAGKYAELIAQMYEWRNDPQWVSYKSHTDRWDRALLALGETVEDASLTPMTADEAQALADQDWGTRWVPVAAAIKDIESGGQQETPNRAPTVSAALGDVTLINGDASGAQEVSLSGVFSDADGDELTFTAASSDATVALVWITTDQSGVGILGDYRGTATVTVTADDGNGGTVADSFTVTVKAAPVVASALADVTGLEAGDEQFVLLPGVFSDADGDALTISAGSSNTAAATVSVTSDYGRLTVTGVAAGTATVTVTAQDSDGNRVSDAFDVTVVAAPVAQEPDPQPQQEPEQTTQEKYADLITQMKEWRNDPQWVDHKEHTDRWDRALLAFGETVSDTSLTPMTADEAQAFADKGWQRWVEVAKALRDIEGG